MQLSLICELNIKKSVNLIINRSISKYIIVVLDNTMHILTKMLLLIIYIQLMMG